MIFHNDNSKKKNYLIKLSLFCAFIYIAITFLIFLLIDIKQQHRIFFIALLSLLLIYYIYLIFKTNKNYDKLSIETFEDKLVVSMPKRTIEIHFNEIIEIISYPTILDKHQLIIHCEKWKALSISSYLENFEELKSILFSIKPLSQRKGIARRIFDYSYIVSVFSAIIATSVKNFPATCVFASIGILSSVFNIFRYAKSKIRVSQKVTGIIAHSILVVALLFSMIVYGKIAKNFSYRKNLEGKTVLMNKEEVSKYDKQGNLKYHKTEFEEEFYTYDFDNNIMYCKSKFDSEEILYTYKNDNLVEVKYSDGTLYTYEYDENGNETCYADNQGYSEWSTYDSNNNLIEIVDSYGFHQFFKYDEHNNLIYQNNDDNEYYTYTYDEKNRCIKTEGENYIMTSEYNNKDQLILQTSFMDNERVSTKKIEYDDKGNEIHLEYRTCNKDGEEIYYQDIQKLYDEHNNVIKIQKNDGSSTEYSYDYDKSGHILRSFSYSE